jgi:hypothetical protein
MVMSLETEQAQRVAEYSLWYEHPTSKAFRMALYLALRYMWSAKQSVLGVHVA